MKQSPKTAQNPGPAANQAPAKNAKQQFKIKSWYSNRYQIVVVQRNILLLLAILLTISMTGAIIFVKYVVSSKSLEPYVIEVEEKSGVPTIVDQMTTKTLTADESVKKYFISQFVQAAAGYDARTYKADAEKVRLLSVQGVYSNFRTRINPRDLGVDSRIEVRIKSIQFPDPSTAQIRVLRNTVSNNGNSQKDEVINMNFYFANLNLTAEERLINPLGFQVTNFTITEEIFGY
ncbi:MAG: type secretion system protein VirB8 [Rickettsiaceae bacterium]|jgi:type IV secretion system protein VirB8|nr:type secretion system protein VirB8 [Rickettsiaceae bacterium]